MAPEAEGVPVQKGAVISVEPPDILLKPNASGAPIWVVSDDDGIFPMLVRCVVGSVIGPIGL